MNLYGGDILFKQNKNNLLNLSSHNISADIKEALSNGLNCHVSSKFNITQQKGEIEKLYD